MCVLPRLVACCVTGTGRVCSLWCGGAGATMCIGPCPCGARGCPRRPHRFRRALLGACPPAGVLPGTLPAAWCRVDLVLVGAEAVVESGGVINKLGTYQVAWKLLLLAAWGLGARAPAAVKDASRVATASETPWPALPPARRRLPSRPRSTTCRSMWRQRATSLPGGQRMLAVAAGALCRPPATAAMRQPWQGLATSWHGLPTSAPATNYAALLNLEPCPPCNAAGCSP